LTELFGDDQNLAGGKKGTLEADFVTSVTQIYSDPPEAATVYEGDFVGGIINAETSAKVGNGADFFPFPAIEGTPGEGGIVGAGDAGVALTDSEEAQQFLTFLATPEAGEIWASSEASRPRTPNVSLDVYPDEISQRIAETVVQVSEEDLFRGDWRLLLLPGRTSIGQRSPSVWVSRAPGGDER